MSAIDEETEALIYRKMIELRDLVAKLRPTAALFQGGSFDPSLVIVAVGAAMTADLHTATKVFVDKWMPIRPELEVIEGGRGDDDGGAQ